MEYYSAAALKAYPQYCCKGEPFKVGKGNLFQYDRDTEKVAFCAGNEQTYEFLENILTEVITIFDSPYIHIGGDERTPHLWEKCPKCSAKMKELGFTHEGELQCWFMNRISKFLADKGRTSVAWAEVYAEAEALSAAHTGKLGTRALDVLHVASAAALGVKEFYTFDARQKALAMKAGMKVKP